MAKGLTDGSYKQLNALPPSAFLEPENFITEYDGQTPGYAEEQYKRGLDIGRRAYHISVSANGVWSAEMRETEQGERQFSRFHSHEGIGYHAHTADLLRGFLDSGCKIIIHRWTDGGIESMTIKE